MLPAPQLLIWTRSEGEQTVENTAKKAHAGQFSRLPSTEAFFLMGLSLFHLDETKINC